MQPIPHAPAAYAYGGMPLVFPGIQPPHRSPNQQLCDAVKYASEDDFVQLMKMALDEGAHLDIADDEGKSLLKLAVERNSVRIAQALVARGAPLPDESQDGVDLLMEAASFDNSDMIKLLVDSGNMDTDGVGRTGTTALHYAVRLNAMKAIAALLDRDGDIDAAANGMEAEELDQIFGQRHHLHHTAITPLAIAVATRHIPTAQLLLERGATIASAGASPLLIATRQRDPAMLELLIAHCKRHDWLPEVFDRKLLRSAIVSQTTTQCLRLILDCYTTHTTDDPDLDGALQLAFSLGHVDQAAVLIAERPSSVVSPEDHLSTWVTASTHEDPALLHLLTISQKVRFINLLVHRSADPYAALLTQLCNFQKNPVDLALRGILAPAISHAMPRLQDIAAQQQTMAMAQIAVETAHALSCIATHSSVGGALGNQISIHDFAEFAAQHQRNMLMPPHSQSRVIAVAIEEQRQLIHEVAESAMGSLPSALTHCLSPEFLRESREASASDEDHQDSADIPFILCEKMRETVGLPNELAELIATRWEEAEQIVARNQSSGEAPDAARVARLMSGTLYCKADELRTDPGSLLHHCKHLLIGLLSGPRERWQGLIRQPAEFLRALEHRTSLRPVDVRALSRSLLTATELPDAVCEALASCWQRAVSEANQHRGVAYGSERFQALDSAFANHWQSWLEEHAPDAGEASLPLTPEEVLRSIAWCEWVRQRPDNPLKRKAGAEAEGAPARKPARQE